MKNLIKILSVMALAFTVANCGKKNNGGGGGDVAPTQRTTDATEIQYDDGNTPIIWSNVSSNIYINTSSNCFKGISSSADDEGFQALEQNLLSLVNSSTISKGTKESVSTRSVYLSIRYSNGEVKTFNLVAEEASVDEEVLSNGQQIIDYFVSTKTNIDSNGVQSCRTGK